MTTVVPLTRLKSFPPDACHLRLAPGRLAWCLVAALWLGWTALTLSGGVALGSGLGGTVRVASASTSEAPVLTALSCSSGTACTAIGYWPSITGVGPGPPVAERWNGRFWSIQRIAAPAGSDLGAVSCPSHPMCVAVGDSSAPSGPGRPLLERWNGRSWSPQRVPSLPIPYDVSCSSPPACTAVGASSLAARWNGRRWSIQHTRAPANSFFSAVSCPTNTQCVALGFVGDTGRYEAERWDGTRWSRQSVPGSPEGQAQISDMSCSSIHACVAVGSWIELCRGDAVSKAAYVCPRGRLVWRLTGSGWSFRSDFSGGSYSAVSCVSAKWCVATADSGLRLWNGHRWSNQSTPTLNDTLSAVSCTSARKCIAISIHGTTALRWNGRRWSLLPAPAKGSS
jgi:hypothetical protein